ncbi:MAG: hypothetical protein HPY64_11370 [Anaerolineae bacterium]|nr:hypothetical protein [Anaerolineae bacterium]
MSEQPSLEQLLRDGMSAAREGDRARARALFEQVIARDPNHEKAWYWLAAVMETDQERIRALKKVLAINPHNERARQILKRLQTHVDDLFGDDEGEDDRRDLIPGVSRRTLILIAGGLGVLVLAIIVLAAIIISNNALAAQQSQATLAAMQATRDQIARDNEATFAAATANPPTPTPIPGRPTLPPTWTPAASPTLASGPGATPLPTVIGSGLVGGRLLAVSGPDFVGEGFVPVVEIPLDGNPPRTLYDDRGGSPDMSPLGDRLIYTRFSVGTREQGLEIAYLDGSRPPQLLSQLIGSAILQKQDYGSFSPDGTRIAFTAREPGRTNNDIYILSLNLLDAPPPPDGQPAQPALVRLTNGTVNSVAPTWGDSTRLVYVHDARPAGGTVDLKLIDLSGQSDFLTADGNLLIEGNPDISPNGQQVAYDAYSPANPDDIDIYIQSLIGGQPLLIVDTLGRAVRPRWSPDGRFLAYSSDQDGDFEIFIVEVASYAVYQVTVNNVYDMVNEWLP